MTKIKTYREIVQKQTQNRKEKAVQTIEKVLRLVGAFLDVPPKTFQIKSRQRKVVVAKQMACAIIRQMDKSIPLVLIGEKLNQHHATIIHSIKTFNNNLATDNILRTQFNDVLDKVNHNFKGYEVLVNDNDLNIKDLPYINLDNCIGLEFPNGKSVVLKGYSDEEAELMAVWGSTAENPVKTTKFTNTGILLVDWTALNPKN